MANKPPANPPLECPKCKSPIASGMKFCESCGAKVEQFPVCEECGALLLPNAKFCESCGKPVAAVVSAAPPTPVPKVVPVPPVVKLPTPAPVPAPVPAEVKKPEPKLEPAPAVKEKIPDKKSPDKPKEILPKVPAKVPASRTQTLVIAGVVGLVIIAALAYFVLLPMLSAPGTTSGGTSSPLAGVLPTTTSAAMGTPAQTAASVSFVTEPTQLPPTELLVTYQAERDPITGLVTVTFTGGAGKNGVSDVFIKLTRSDGQVLTRTFTPQQIGSFTTLEGTRMTDRIEVTANYYNGAKYKIIDQLFEYKKRNI